jgi:hypothetical protein
VRKNNTYGHSYTSDYRSTGGMGVFAVPEPGTRVRIMFENGNLSSPIIVGQVNTSDEFAAIYKSGKAYPTLPKASQNYFKSSSDSSKNESHTAKGGDSELTREYQGVVNEQLDVTRQLMSGNLTDEQKGDLQWKNYQLGQQAESLATSAPDSDLARLSEITASGARRQADIIDKNPNKFSPWLMYEIPLTKSTTPVGSNIPTISPKVLYHLPSLSNSDFSGYTERKNSTTKIFSSLDRLSHFS